MGVFGMSIETPCCWNPLHSTYEYDKKEKDYIIRGVHSYIQQFFGPSIMYQVNSKNVLPISLENVESSSIKCPENTKPEELEACFQNSPNQKTTIHLEGPLAGNICSDSVIYKADFLDVDCLRNRKESEILRHFKGKRLRCMNTSFSNSQVIEFLNAWKSGQMLKKSKLLGIHTNFDLNEDEIMGKVDHIKFNKRHGNKENTVATTTGQYLIRESDGQKGYLTISQMSVHLAVFGQTGGHVNFDI
ncbi:hypothetical protein GCK72_007005 [Caenorhabditis remanei]|uniref:F-box associated domain-containing protein n=1 Tax=Caenorhabditis remanei TaxID=31234 RepID=A0A6A5HKF2_CAERE|nr:hypothetical protein GCK72_007005 [Caenorhabditis remanei]KAF1767047.1 hypothetical protein GCK72_007005 [Caenorhabditis remanei]